MKAIIEIEEGEYALDSLRAEIVRELATKACPYYDMEQIKKELRQNVDKEKKIILKEFENRISSMDELEISQITNRFFEKTWINKVSEQIFQKLKGDSDFIGKLSKEVIKGLK